MKRPMISASTSKLIIIFLFLTIGIVPLLILMIMGATDPFLHMIVASTIEYQKDGYVHGTSSALVRDAPLYYYITIPLSNITGISLETMQYLPFTGIIMMIAFVLLSRRFLRIEPAILATLAFTLTFIPPNNYSIWPHAFGISTFILFVAIYIDYIKKRTAPLALALIILLISTVLYSYTAGLWTISVTFFSSTMLFLRKKEGKQTYAFFFVSLAIFLTFSDVVYGSFLPTFSRNVTNLGSIFNFENLFGLNGPSISNPFSPTPPALLLRIPGIIRFILLTVPIVIVLFLALFRKNLSRRKIERRLSVQDIVIISLLLTVIPDSLAYALGGQQLLSTILRLFLFVAPIACLVCVGIIFSRIKRHQNAPQDVRINMNLKSQITYGSIVVIVSALSLALVISSGSIATSYEHYTNVDSSASWILEHREGKIISDMQTMGRVEVVGALLNYNLTIYEDLYYFDIYVYEYFIGSNVSASDYGLNGSLFIFNLDTATQVAMGDNWVNLRPIETILPYVNQNQLLNRIFDQPSIAIYIGA